MTISFGTLTPNAPSSIGYNQNTGEWISAAMELYCTTPVTNTPPGTTPPGANIKEPRKPDNSALIDIPTSVSIYSAVWISLNYGLIGLGANPKIHINVRLEGVASKILDLLVYVGKNCVAQIPVSGPAGQITTLPLELFNIANQTIQPRGDPDPQSQPAPAPIGSYTDIILIAILDPNRLATDGDNFTLIEIDGEIEP
jgi:hypothetical protein